MMWETYPRTSPRQWTRSASSPRPRSASVALEPAISRAAPTRVGRGKKARGQHQHQPRTWWSTCPDSNEAFTMWWRERWSAWTRTTRRCRRLTLAGDGQQESRVECATDQIASENREGEERTCGERRHRVPEKDNHKQHRPTDRPGEIEPPEKLS